MALYLVLTYFIIFSFTCIRGDFLSNLDKLDIDTKLSEIDKAINSIDKGDDSIIGKARPKTRNPKVEDDQPDLGDTMETLAGMFGGGECKYQCKNGNKPVPKKEHVPTSDGCGSSGIKIDTEAIPGAEDCCNEHDYCYDTCNSDRTTCDKEFKTCLYTTCNKLKTSKSKMKISYKECKGTADLMYGGTIALGCDPFLKAQAKACNCSNTPKSEKDKKLSQKNEAKKKSATYSATNDKKGRTTSGRRSDEL